MKSGSIETPDLITALDELGFIRAEDEPDAAPAPLRWRRLSRALFSPPAWLCYGALVCWAVIAMVRSPDLLPYYRNIFFV